MTTSPPSGSLAWVQSTVRELVLESPENVLDDRGGIPIFTEPLVGVADGYSPAFEAFREAVSPRHLMPPEILAAQAPSSRGGPVRVIVWALPFSAEVRRSNRHMDEWPSSLYSQARNNAAALNEKVGRLLVERLTERGYAAVAPILSDAYDAFRAEGHVFSSTWSERHVAYAAGMGRFGLNAALITPAGIAVRIGSVVTNLDLEPTGAPPPGSHLFPCLGEEGEDCARCIERCPVGAISRDGLDKERCYARRNEVRERFLPTYRETLHLLPADIVKNGQRRAGNSVGCALCEFGVPCESTSPPTGAPGHRPK